MRVCMITTSYPRWPGDSAGVFVAKLALYLTKEQNIEVTVLAPADTGVSLYERTDKVDVHRIKYFWPSRLQKLAYRHGIPWNIKYDKIAKLNTPFFLLAFAWKLCIYARRADIIHAHWGGLGAVAVATRFIHRLPVVVMVRGTDLSTKSKLIRWITEWAVKRADAVVTNSPEYYQPCCNLRREERSCHYVHNGVEYPSDQELEELRAKHANRRDGINIVSMARLIPERRYDLLIRAFAKLYRQHPNTTLTIVGDGPHRGALESLVEELGLYDHVKFIGTVPHNEVFGYLARADMYVSATTVEAQGNAVLEAAAYGLPVVTTDVGFPSELVIDGETGFVVNPNDEQGLIDAMNRLLSNHERMKVAGRRMRERVRSMDLSWSVCTRKNLDVYKTCLANRS